VIQISPQKVSLLLEVTKQYYPKLVYVQLLSYGVQRKIGPRLELIFESGAKICDLQPAQSKKAIGSSISDTKRTAEDYDH
jgi:hypothetical protein